ncbi:UNVERIFIED_CONTAM: hypothetical protein GTU68_038197 [Idotea baltica]|nr:hypothetical protein [Idotea baltica]
MIAILGGTFDPIHFGHLRPALEIVEKLNLSELRFIPSAKPPHRWQPEADAKHRLNMVKKAIKAYPKFVIDEREYHRLKKDNIASYTIDTVQSIRDEVGEIESVGMIVGMDAFQSFTSWKDWEAILDNVHLIVASRPGYDELNDSNENLDWVHKRLVNKANELHDSAFGKVFFCDVTQLDISATYIRNQLDKTNSCCYLTPKSVVNYIQKNDLYLAKP